MQATWQRPALPTLPGKCHVVSKWQPTSANESSARKICQPLAISAAGRQTVASSSSYNAGSLRRLGQSDLLVSRLCFGTMTFGEGTSYSEACGLLNLAVDSGINFFDSAEMYPVPQRAETQGLSESYLGRWLKESGLPRDQFVIATKVAGPSGEMVWIRGGPPAVDAKNIVNAIEGSLRRLGTDFIDLYQIHWPDRYVPMFGETEYDCKKDYAAVPLEEQLEALSKAVEEGKIRYIGLSNETPWGLMEFCRLANGSSHLKKIVSIQNSYSLLCRTFDSGLSECCYRENISLLAYSPLAMGLLTGKYYKPGNGGLSSRLNKYRGRYSEAESRYPLENPRVRGAVLDYVKIAEKYNIRPSVLALSFVTRHPLVASAITGATNLDQLEELLGALVVELSVEVMEEIEEVHSRNTNPTP